jgi:hypothetical protein
VRHPVNHVSRPKSGIHAKWSRQAVGRARRPGRQLTPSKTGRVELGARQTVRQGGLVAGQTGFQSGLDKLPGPMARFASRVAAPPGRWATTGRAQDGRISIVSNLT